MATSKHPPTSIAPLSPDRTYELLAHRLRRSILACLSTHGPLALADLATEVARRERDTPLSELPTDESQRIHVLLWHIHVPKLDNADVVEHDHDTNVVALAANADQLERVLAENTPGWEDSR